MTLLLFLSSLRILPILIFSLFAVHEGPDEQEETADKGDQPDKKPPAAFPDVVQAPDRYAEIRDKHDEIEDCHQDIGCRRVFTESKAQNQEKQGDQTIDESKCPVLPPAGPAAEVCEF